MLGGLKAAAITDAVQGVLILVMSIILIPVGLAEGRRLAFAAHEAFAEHVLS